MKKGQPSSGTSKKAPLFFYKTEIFLFVENFFVIQYFLAKITDLKTEIYSTEMFFLLKKTYLTMYNDYTFIPLFDPV